MKRKISALFIGLLLPIAVFAKDGLVLHFKITKVLPGQSSSYANGVLMQLNEAITTTFPGQYEMHFDVNALEDGMENVVVTVKDISSGKPVYVGSAAAAFKIGESRTVQLHQLEAAVAKYELFIDTAYGPLPRLAQ